MTRQDYNKQIMELPVLAHVQENLDWDFLNTLNDFIDKCPNQRFGQIVTNYFCGDYRDVRVSDDTKMIMKSLFDIGYDPFFEESYETYNRLKLI